MKDHSRIRLKRSYQNGTGLGLGVVLSSIFACVLAIGFLEIGKLCSEPQERTVNISPAQLILPPPPPLVAGADMDCSPATGGVLVTQMQTEARIKFGNGWHGNTWDGVFEDPAGSGAGCDGGWIKIVAPSSSVLDMILVCRSVVLPINPTDSIDLTAVLRLLIDPRGDVANVIIEETSRNVPFDQDCVVTAYLSRYRWYDDQRRGIWVRRVLKYTRGQRMASR